MDIKGRSFHTSSSTSQKVPKQMSSGYIQGLCDRENKIMVISRSSPRSNGDQTVTLYPVPYVGTLTWIFFIPYFETFGNVAIGRL